MASVLDTGLTSVNEYRLFGQLAGGYSNFRAGDLLVAKITPCFENNKIALANIDTPHGFGSSEFHVVRPRFGALDAEYLLYFLRQDSIRQEGARRMTGSAGQKRVPRQFLTDLLIPFPPLDEQRRIAAILSQADGLRLKRRLALKKLNHLPQATFQEMFGDPVANPKGWHLRSLSEIGELERGVSKHRPRNDPTLLGGPYPLIQTGDIANSGGYIRNYSNSYSEIGLRQSRLWPKGTLCITIAANIGKTGILDFDACFPDSVVGFTPGASVTSEYVRIWMSFVERKLESLAPQFAQKNINLAILRELRIPLPPITMQEKFTSILGCLERLAASQREHLARLDEAFASLQHRAFSGQVLRSDSATALAV